MTVRAGELDYIALIENCTFERNSGYNEVAVESGAAASLSSQFFFGSSQQIPVLIFRDW